MPAAAWQEARLALQARCGWRAAIGAGLACFDLSIDGFWRSFRAAVIAYPLFLVLLSMRVTVAEWDGRALADRHWSRRSLMSSRGRPFR